MAGKREIPEINAASMADIAFLLLIFFILITTIETNEGLARVLPPMPVENQPIVEINKKNVFEVRVNSNDQLLVEGEYLTIGQLKEATKRFILNNGVDPNLSTSPQEAVVSLKNDRGTSYNMYIMVQNELTAAYNEIRDAEARKRFGKAYDELDEKSQKVIKDLYPMKVSEAEPVNIGGAK